MQMLPSQNKTYAERLAEKLTRQANKRGEDSVFTEEAKRALKTVDGVPVGNAESVTEKPKKTGDK